jgi:hypothetical protein
MDYQPWPALEAANAHELLVYLGASPLAEHHISDDIAWVITGVDVNDYNGVAWARLPEDRADTTIAEVLARFRARNVPFLWYVTADSRPADLGQRLLAHGCIKLSSGVGMAADLHTTNETQRDVPGLVIRRVTDEADLARWCSVYDDDRERREPLFASLGLNGERPLCHYLALLDGQAVGTSSLFLANESVGLYHVEVVPWAWKQGIGTAITLAPLREARALGYRVAVLAPTPESQNMYRRIGFVLHDGVDEWYTLPPT